VECVPLGAARQGIVAAAAPNRAETLVPDLVHLADRLGAGRRHRAAAIARIAIVITGLVPAAGGREITDLNAIDRRFRAFCVCVDPTALAARLVRRDNKQHQRKKTHYQRSRHRALPSRPGCRSPNELWINIPLCASSRNVLYAARRRSRPTPPSGLKPRAVGRPLCRRPPRGVRGQGGRRAAPVSGRPGHLALRPAARPAAHKRLIHFGGSTGSGQVAEQRRQQLRVD
jgi:hypothetical protein